jgi:hypothetical protein
MMEEANAQSINFTAFLVIRIFLNGTDPVLNTGVYQTDPRANMTVILSFQNMLADKLHGTDPEDVIVSAFKLFDPDGKGVISKVGMLLVPTAARSFP